MLVEYHRAISMRGEEEEGSIGIKQARAGRVRIPRFSSVGSNACGPRVAF